MAEELLVDERIGEGIDIVALLDEAGLETAGAFWIQVEQDSPWNLYIAYPSAEVNHAGGVYQFLNKIVKAMEWQGMQTQISDIKFVDEDSPMAVEAADLARRHPSRDFITIRDCRFGGRSITEAVVYTTQGLKGDWPRLSYQVTYHRQGDTNEWSAETERNGVYRKIRAKGAVSYSTASWVGEPEGQEKFAMVSVLLEIDPVFDNPKMLDMPEVKRMMAEQARTLADAMFLERWPGATITHLNHETV